MNFLAKLGAALLVLSYFSETVEATWQPEAGFTPSPAVQAWFNEQKYCCLKAERVRTKFRVSKVDGKDVWEKLDGQTWHAMYPAYGITEEGVVPPKGYEHALVDDLQFQQLRAEGVLFVYNGRDFCFFTPQSGG